LLIGLNFDLHNSHNGLLNAPILFRSLQLISCQFSPDLLLLVYCLLFTLIFAISLSYESLQPFWRSFLGKNLHQQPQKRLRRLVGLGQHCCAGLLQDIEAGELRAFLRYIHIDDPAVGCLQVGFV
jgi:hypothetical protein